MPDGEEDWLPPLLLLENFDGDWDRYLAELYRVFRKDFVESRPFFRGQGVGYRKYPISRGKEAGFWHVISEGKEEEERTPDLRRCERIAWIRALIEQETRPEVRCWKSPRPGDRRVILATEGFDFVVVLGLRKDYALLITAFHVERRHRRGKLRKEWEAWWKAQKG